MEAIKIEKTVDQSLINLLPELQTLIGKAVEITVRTSEPQLHEPKRRGGWAKGKLWMADDFDAPLDDFKDYR